MGLRFRVLPPAGLLILGTVVAALAGIVTLELRDEPRGGPSVPIPPSWQQQTSPSVAASRDRPPDQGDQYAATILARPLFSPTRRPPVAAAKPSRDTALELARLTGVIVSPAEKSAIFAGMGGKPVVVGEGAHIGEYVVRSIGIGTVVVTGSDGQRTLNPAFDPNPPPRPAPPAPPAPPPWHFTPAHQTSQ